MAAAWNAETLREKSTLAPGASVEEEVDLAALSAWLGMVVVKIEPIAGEAVVEFFEGVYVDTSSGTVYCSTPFRRRKVSLAAGRAHVEGVKFGAPRLLARVENVGQSPFDVSIYLATEVA